MESRTRTLAALTLLSLVPSPWLAPLGGQAPQRQAGELRRETRSLEAAGGQVVEAEFGRLLVPENRSASQSNLIELAYVRLKSTAPGPWAPIIYLAGGPGGSSTWMAEDPRTLAGWLSLLNVSDLIFLDQRATGRSTPRLRYRPPGEPPPNGFAHERAMKDFYIAAAREAAAHYRSQGVDLDGYNSNESADDINDLRIALGLEKVSLLGFSYGTHLALATIRRHGARLENIVAVGVEGLHQTHKLPLTMDTQFRKLSLMVGEDDQVGPFVPDMVELLERVLEKLEREPMVVEISGPGGQQQKVPVGPVGLKFILRLDIGDASDLPVFPRLLYSIDQGDPSVLQWFVQKRARFAGVDLMGLLMDGASGATPERWSTIAAQAQRSLFGDIVNFRWPEIDEATGVRDLGEAYRAPLVSDVRTLFFSGSLDFNTPPHQAEEIRWGMPNATHIVVENAGHEQIMPQPKVQETIVRFLRGEDVRDVTIVLPPLRFVPIEGYDPEVTHPSVPRPSP